MKNAQFSLDEFTAMLRRRRIPFLIPIIVIVGASTFGAFMMPKRYESSTTILVQDNQVLNPLVNYTMAVAMQTDDRLHNFDEIIYSTPTIEALIDSLGMEGLAQSEPQREQLVKAVSKNIKTDLKGSDSFTISYFAPTPRMAQRAVTVLAELYIQTKLRIENTKNNFAVQFFAQRLNSLRDKFEQSQDQLVGAMKQHVNAIPETDRELYTDIDDYNKQISKLQSEIDDYQQALTILDKAPTSANGKLDVKKLYDLPLLGVPYSTQLQTALVKYDGLLHKYTEQYPDVQDARADLVQMLGRTKSLTQSALTTDESKIWQLEKERNHSIGTVQQATVASSQDQDVKSNFDIYKELYNDMKIKLEQAQTSKDLGENGAREFMVLDPPELPTSPAKPNKPLMILGGGLLGVILGLFSAGLAEIFDSRIRTPMDIELYNKPVIAYLPTADAYHRNAE